MKIFAISSIDQGVGLGDPFLALANEMRNITSDITFSSNVNKPTSSFIELPWDKSVLDNYCENINGSDFVLVDGRLKSEEFYGILIGLLLGKVSYIGKVSFYDDAVKQSKLDALINNRINGTPTEYNKVTIIPNSDNPENPGLLNNEVEVRLDGAMNVIFTSNTPLVEIQSTLLYHANEEVRIILGYCYKVGIHVIYNTAEDDPFIKVIKGR